MSKSYLDYYKEWVESDYLTQDDKEELISIKGDDKEIESRFYTDLSFGTAGMRGVRGVGRNRINIYNIRKATQGLANYILKVTGEEGAKRGVAIAYDCRIGSVEYALNSALVLAANGIKAYLFTSLRSTPELSFATRELKAQAGIMVTASHNPKEYNGYKVYWEDGAQIVEPQASGIVNSVNSVDIFKDIKFIPETEAIKKGLLIYIDKKIDDRFVEEVEKQAINRDIPGKDKFKIVYSPLHGTGRVAVQRVLKEMGFESVYTVPEQEMPNGLFPTCSYANPEDTSVFKLSTELADKVGAKICLANDPDADRTGIAIKDDDGNWYYPNGNQLGILLMNYILEMKKDIPANGAVISTIVSTPMLDVIAKDKKVKLFRTLTGFKYIGEKIRQFENKELDGTFIFGFEESIGYLIGTHVRDKDAVVSSLLISEMAAYYDSVGSTLYKELNKLYEKYGWYREETISVTKQGKSGLEEIGAIMDKLRTHEHNVICCKKVVTYKDFETQVERDMIAGTTSKITLPKSNVIQFILEDNTYITVRPSGTEPKIKYYIGIVDSSKEKAENKLKNIKEQFLDYIEKL
ncbi:Phosphoglucomutase [Fusobacterium sp. DD29]|uniref:phospho-sugar mutase n=1 Tax=unclassified Fusobacterium TaxID=2648384 RepID=UPI001B8D1A4A|nr:MULTISPECIES: phospho-sugar mutase [unclassified Fusobacterium]MBR8701866.1 Phosphoglucomutase [Fusobacterium sp. DD45]MBR8711652.1 Phosphoglucomutase [Fusobacterium sp. DD28]MBR8749209.1 Phosphoglucomutase [Fusobacterium sp. DD29]MBR8752201.1 Phosphoglucomutase [Fusobacterium sp. DD26]MBR8761453.1 Phosphoglucomutase [Fusobacterium sp. DD25]